MLYRLFFRDVRSKLVVRDVSRFAGGSQVGMELRRQRPGFGDTTPDLIRSNLLSGPSARSCHRDQRRAVVCERHALDGGLATLPRRPYRANSNRATAGPTAEKHKSELQSL